ncbi:hypothetical protein XELAEV_18010074mg [Xenopus laevis]|uniref:Uncharacterized protein n=1 Tax=Xenopus laevis TaxID=8355 RepID=A0A974DV69_XENLA|nr:hypothetical protein XELAEV_18010074mg [Xenopus laevis]
MRKVQVRQWLPPSSGGISEPSELLAPMQCWENTKCIRLGAVTGLVQNRVELPWMNLWEAAALPVPSSLIYRESD